MSVADNRVKLAILVLVAASLGWWIGEPTTVEQDKLGAADDEWQLATSPARKDSSRQVLEVGNASYWGAQPAVAPLAATPASGPAPDNRWRIGGVVGRGADLRVLIAFSAGRPPVLLKAGDRLPSGHMIRKIDEKSLCVVIGQKSYVLGLERVGTSP